MNTTTTTTTGKANKGGNGRKTGGGFAEVPQAAPLAPEAPKPPPSSPASSPSSKPTREQTAAYRGAFRHFNRELFGGCLPEVILNFSRHANSLGFFSPERWLGKDGETTTHEISLNPDHLLDRTARESASTLVHEMVHLWRHLRGTPPRRGYHDREWAAQMHEVGLHPSSTAAPGGKEVGTRMSHYIVEGGPFARAFDALPDAHLLPWRSSAFARNGKPCPAKGGKGEGGEGDEGSEPRKRRQDPSKVKYTCEGCGANVWGKGGLLLDCRVCDRPFTDGA